MFKTVFLLFLLSHILGDFYFQSEKTAIEKNRIFKSLIKHTVIYTVITIILIIPLFTPGLLVSALVLSMAHFAIDFLKHYYMRARKIKEVNRKIYVTDQILHLVFIGIISYIFVALKQNVLPLQFIDSIFDTLGISKLQLFKWIILILLIWKPANITIKQLLTFQKPRENSPDNKKAGAFIGVLERLIIMLFLSIGQFSAIGFVLTAKSIARYKEISENKEFAEYYLLGTLLSTFIVLSAFYIVF